MAIGLIERCFSTAVIERRSLQVLAPRTAVTSL